MTLAHASVGRAIATSDATVTLGRWSAEDPRVLATCSACEWSDYVDPTKPPGPDAARRMLGLLQMWGREHLELRHGFAGSESGYHLAMR